MKRKRRLAVIAVLSIVLTALLAASFYRQIFTVAGQYLVLKDTLVKSDAILVLSGEDADGVRTRMAVELYKQGWANKVVLSGARDAFSHYESDFMGPIALASGVPKKDLLILNHRAKSTFEEATAVVPEMERDGIRSIILVSSNFHTRRAKRYFQQVCGDRIRVIAYPSENEYFSPSTWWLTREGRKVFLLESLKEVTSHF